MNAIHGAPRSLGNQRRGNEPNPHPMVNHCGALNHNCRQSSGSLQQFPQMSWQDICLGFREARIAVCFGVYPREVHRLDAKTNTWSAVLRVPPPPVQMHLRLSDYRSVLATYQSHTSGPARQRIRPEAALASHNQPGRVSPMHSYVNRNCDGH